MLDVDNNEKTDVQVSHRLEKYFNMKGFLEKSLKMKSALKNAGESLRY